MKKTNLVFGLALSLIQIATFSAHADSAASAIVTGAQFMLTCNGTTPVLGKIVAINLGTQKDTVNAQIDGDAVKSFSLVNGQVIFQSPNGSPRVIGTLDSVPTCEVLDTGEDATPSWNELKLSNEVSLNLSVSGKINTMDQSNVLTMTDLNSKQAAVISWMAF